MIKIQGYIDNIKNQIDQSRIYTDDLRRFAYGTDASCYRLIPEAVIKVKDEVEMLYCIEMAQKHQVAITFRAAGTSLSGQAITDSVLLLIDNQWNKYKILNDGQQIQLDPGVIGQHANLYLAPYQRKIGPDPASIKAAKIGGIAANNASGMCCGVVNNSYHTLQSMRILFSDAQVLDTGDKKSCEQFIKNNTSMVKALLALANEIKDNPDLKARITHKYRIKNTTGYGLNALVDFDDPIDIIQHLMIGSEGTLGFIANITYNTIEDLKLKSCALVFFKDIFAACRFSVKCAKLPISAVELMDNLSLQTMMGKEGAPDILNKLDEHCAALLIEVEADNNQMLQQNQHVVYQALEKEARFLDHEVLFSVSDDEHKSLWKIRKGIFPAIGGAREIGSSAIIEDVAVKPEYLADLCLDIQALFKKYNYLHSAIYGHALAGNLHFVFTPRFDSEKEVKRFDNFLKDMVNTVVKKYDGSVKAEHGTGRNMTPFVNVEWGAELYAIHKRIKHIFDPMNILNPGVIINEDEMLHIKDLKRLSEADPLVDHCIECGFCEHVCPARNLSLTPRQRITTYREISRLKQNKKLHPLDKERLSQLEKGYQYQGVDTCAATGLCQLECPVAINTGELMLKLRAQESSKLSHYVAMIIAKNFSFFLVIMRFLLRVLYNLRKILGDRVIEKILMIIAPIAKVKLYRTLKYLPNSIIKKLRSKP